MPYAQGNSPSTSPLYFPQTFGMMQTICKFDEEATRAITENKINWD